MLVDLRGVFALLCELLSGLAEGDLKLAARLPQVHDRHREQQGCSNFRAKPKIRARRKRRERGRGRLDLKKLGSVWQVGIVG